MSIAPAPAIRVSTPSRWERSAGTWIASSSAVSAAIDWGSPKPDSTICAPSARSARAIARPMPEVEPVTSARLPSRNILDSIRWSGKDTFAFAAWHAQARENEGDDKDAARRFRPPRREYRGSARRHAAGGHAGRQDRLRHAGDRPDRRRGLWRRPRTDAGRASGSAATAGTGPAPRPRRQDRRRKLHGRRVEPRDM